MHRPDSILIEQTLAGRREAFEILLRRHGPVLWAAIATRVADPEEARDIYQDTVVKAYEQIGRLREPERLRSWWLSIALNSLRSLGRRQRPDLHERVPDRADEDAEAPGERLEAREDLERLRTELAALPPRQREVCRLRLVDGLSHTAIAELLGITADASRANAYQALKRLRERMGAS